MTAIAHSTAVGDALDALRSIVDTVERADDPLDSLGALRLVELQVPAVRRAVVAQARAQGLGWDEIGSTLALPAQEAERRYGEV